MLLGVMIASGNGSSFVFLSFSYCVCVCVCMRFNDGLKLFGNLVVSLHLRAMAGFSLMILMWHFVLHCQFDYDIRYYAHDFHGCLVFHNVI